MFNKLFFKSKNLVPDRVYNPFSAITDEQYLLGQRDIMMDKLLVWPKIKLKGNLLHSLADYCTLIVLHSVRVLIRFYLPKYLKKH